MLIFLGITLSSAIVAVCYRRAFLLSPSARGAKQLSAAWRESLESISSTNIAGAKRKTPMRRENQTSIEIINTKITPFASNQRNLVTRPTEILSARGSITLLATISWTFSPVSQLRSFSH
jgi:hypothetical protein